MNTEFISDPYFFFVPECRLSWSDCIDLFKEVSE